MLQSRLSSGLPFIFPPIGGLEPGLEEGHSLSTKSRGSNPNPPIRLPTNSRCIWHLLTYLAHPALRAGRIPFNPRGTCPMKQNTQATRFFSSHGPKAAVVLFCLFLSFFLSCLLFFPQEPPPVLGRLPVFNLQSSQWTASTLVTTQGHEEAVSRGQQSSQALQSSVHECCKNGNPAQLPKWQLKNLKQTFGGRMTANEPRRKPKVESVTLKKRVPSPIFQLQSAASTSSTESSRGKGEF